MRGLCALASRALQAAFERTQRRTSSARLRTTSPGATVWEELTRTVVPARGHDSCNIRDVPTTSRTGGTLRSAPPARPRPPDRWVGANAIVGHRSQTAEPLNRWRLSDLMPPATLARRAGLVQTA